MAQGELIHFARAVFMLLGPQAGRSAGLGRATPQAQEKAIAEAKAMAEEAE